MSWQGRAGADGARGMPGESGSKVTSLVSFANGTDLHSWKIKSVNSYKLVVEFKHIHFSLDVFYIFSVLKQHNEPFWPWLRVTASTVDQISTSCVTVIIPHVCVPHVCVSLSGWPWLRWSSWFARWQRTQGEHRKATYADSDDLVFV